MLTGSEISIVNRIQPKINKINKYLDDYKRIKESEYSQISNQSYAQNDSLSLMKSQSTLMDSSIFMGEPEN